MKKILVSLFIVILLFSLVSCSFISNSKNTENSGIVADTQTEPSKETKHQLRETISTDIIDFTLQKAQFSYYASATTSTFAEPISESDGGIFTSSTGRCYVCMTYTLKYKGRGSININDFRDWVLKFKVKYNGETYPLNSWNLNDKDGDDRGLTFIAVSYDGGKTFEDKRLANFILQAGQTIVVRTFGVIKLEPDNLNDPFDLEVNLFNSDDENEYFIYEIK